MPALVGVRRQFIGHIIALLGQKPFRRVPIFAIEAAARHDFDESTILEHLQRGGDFCFSDAQSLGPFTNGVGDPTIVTAGTRISHADLDVESPGDRIQAFPCFASQQRMI